LLEETAELLALAPRGLARERMVHSTHTQSARTTKTPPTVGSVMIKARSGAAGGGWEGGAVTTSVLSATAVAIGADVMVRPVKAEANSALDSCVEMVVTRAEAADASATVISTTMITLAGRTVTATADGSTPASSAKRLARSAVTEAL